MSIDLTGAEIDMLLGLPKQVAATQSGNGKRAQADLARRTRLQRAGLLSVQALASGVFLVAITEKGVEALQACRPGGAR